MAPTLVNSYKTEDNVLDSATLVSPSFTPVTGEILVVKAANENATMTFGATPTASGFTVGSWTQRVSNGSGTSTCRAALYTGIVTSGGTAGTISLTAAGASVKHAMVVERWSNAQLAGSPVLANTSGDATSPWTTAITTAAANSVISYVCADWSAANSSGVAFAGDTATPTQEQTATFQTGNYTAYWLYQAATSAGSNTIGLSAPAGMTVNTAGLEIQDAGGGPTGPAPKVLAPRTRIPTHSHRRGRARFGG
jgi:hypothetical protein